MVRNYCSSFLKDAHLQLWQLISRRLVIAYLPFTFSLVYAQEYDKAVIEPADVEKAIVITKELDARKDQPVPKDTPWFEVKKGTIPVIITAPHATQPYRDKKYRFSDGGGTGGLAVALHDICDVTVVYTTYDSPSDPNYYDNNEFKAALERLINEVKPALLLDIHASNPYRPYDVDLGTMDGNSLRGDSSIVPDLINVFNKEGILSISMNRFSASTNQTITKYASAKGIPSVQLEFNSTRVSPSESDFAAHRFSQTLEAMAVFLGKRGQCTWKNKQ